MADRSGRAAARLWAGAEVRRRWRSIVILGVLAGVTAGIALAATAGARRTDTAWTRLRAVTHASDAVAFPSNVRISNPDWGPIAARPDVEAIGAFGFPAYSEHDVCLLASVYGTWLTDIDTPRVLHGRLPDPAHPEEVMVSSLQGGMAGDDSCPVRHVGDRVTIHLYSAPQLEGGDPGEPAGPTVELHVVGETITTFDLAVIPDTAGNLFAPPAFWARYGKDGAASFSNALVRLRSGQAGVPALQTAINESLGRPIPVRDLVDAGKRVTNGTDLERNGLLLFAAACALAGIVVVGQALGRAIRATDTEMGVLAALGLPRPGRALGLALAYGLATLVALPIAIGLAIALSPLLPIGLGARVEPDPGLHADWLVLGLGALALSVALVTQTIVAAWRAARPRSSVDVPRTSAFAGLLARAGLPVSAVVGTRLALEPGRGRRALPTRPALAAAVVGLLGVAAAVSLASGIDDASRHTARFGAVWDLEFGYEEDEAPPAFERMMASLPSDGDIAAVAQIYRGIVDAGKTTVPAFAVDSQKGSIEFAVYSGRAPRTDHEVALGPSTAHTLGVQTGDAVTIEGREFTMVGEVLLPQTPHSSYDQGASFTASTLAGLNVDASPTPVASVRNGASIPAVEHRLADLGGPGTVVQPGRSADQRSLDNVRSLPVLFGVFVTLLAMAGIAHVGATVVRRRRGELATLRALGWTPRQAFACMLWQATTLVLLAAVIGSPVGLAAGRALWRAVAAATPFIYVAPGVTLLLASSVPIGVLLANAIGSISGWRAARLRPAEVLRTE
jgi:hypothetical protein